jgi:hypothetical protein
LVPPLAEGAGVGETGSAMARQAEEDGARPGPAIFGAGLAAGASALTVLAVALAAVDAGAPYEWLKGRGGLAFFAVFLAALTVGVARSAVEWRRGASLLQPDGGLADFALAIALFQLASIPGAVALGLAAVVAAVAGSPLAELIVRALLLLVVGGVWLAIGAGLVRDLLLLARLR